MGLIQAKTDKKERKIIFKLTIPRQEIKKYTGNNEPGGSLSLDFEPLNGRIKSKNEEMYDTNISNNLRYKKSPLVVSRTVNISTKKTKFEFK